MRMTILVSNDVGTDIFHPLPVALEAGFFPFHTPIVANDHDRVRRLFVVARDVLWMEFPHFDRDSQGLRMDPALLP